MIERGFFKGKAVETHAPEYDIHSRQAATALSTAFLDSNLSREKRETGKPLWIVFDVDGVLVEHSMTAEHLDGHLAEEHQTVDNFRKSIQRAQQLGYHIALCTGRPHSFARLIAQKLCGASTPEVVISESGIVIECNGQVTHPSTADLNDLHSVVEHKASTIAHFAQLGWGHYAQEYAISLRFPETLSNGIAHTQVRAYLDSIGLLDRVEIIQARTAIDVLPKGSDKQSALQDVVGSGEMIYFGDSSGDHIPMTNSIVVVTPENATHETQAHAAESTGRDSTKTRFALHMQKPLLAGVVDALGVINDTTSFLASSDLTPLPQE